MIQNLKHKLTASRVGLLLIIYYSVGLVGLSMPVSRELFIGLMPFTILLSIGILLFFHDSWRLKDGLVFLLIALLGYLVEVAGVLTGEVFGEYSYGRALGFRIFETPLLIGINWLMLIYCVYAIFEKYKIPVWGRIFSGATLMVIYDLILEPVAIRLDMWSWGDVDIPLQNYVAWFIISVILLAIMHLFKITLKNRVAPWLFGVQTGFFLLLNFLLRVI